MALSKEEKARRRAAAAGPYPKPRGRAPMGSNGLPKHWDQAGGGWKDSPTPDATLAVEEDGAAQHEKAELRSPAWKQLARERLAAEQQAAQQRKDERAARGQFRCEQLKIWHGRHLGRQCSEQELTAHLANRAQRVLKPREGVLVCEKVLCSVSECAYETASASARHIAWEDLCPAVAS